MAKICSVNFSFSHKLSFDTIFAQQEFIEVANEKKTSVGLDFKGRETI